ncbi:MAG: sodium:solute symporter [Paludibacteraceae bacterium]
MSPILVLSIIFVYFAVLFAVSYIAGRKTDKAGFYTGNRSNHWLLVAMSTIGAAMSGVTFVSVPGMVGTSGWGYMQMVLGFTVGQLVLAYGLVPLYYKHNLTSIYQYLQQRLGMHSYHTGAWFFFISKLLGASVRLFIVTEVLQLLVFSPLGIPYWANALFAVGIAYLCTFRGGVKSLVWTDLLKTICMVGSVGLCIWFILRALPDFAFGYGQESATPLPRMFYFDDPKDGNYFWKQFVAGIVLLIGTTGIDQDMMQRTLSCRNYRESQKNILLGASMQVVVIGLFLFLGYLLYAYADKMQIAIPDNPDDVFPYLAAGGYFPTIVGILFIIGFISSAYSSACGALTALTTSFSVDILDNFSGQQSVVSGQLSRDKRRCPSWCSHWYSHLQTNKLGIVHFFMAVLMAVCIMVIHMLNNDSVIQTVFLVASYTYGPLLGMFAFGILTKWQIRDRLIPLMAIAAPVITYTIDIHSAVWFNGYVFSHERLLLNAALIFAGMVAIRSQKTKIESHDELQK